MDPYPTGGILIHGQSQARDCSFGLTQKISLHSVSLGIVQTQADRFEPHDLANRFRNTREQALYIATARDGTRESDNGLINFRKGGPHAGIISQFSLQYRSGNTKANRRWLPSRT